MSLFCDFRVRSVIILQDKPQDREKLLLKFLKTMKVTHAGGMVLYLQSGYHVLPAVAEKESCTQKVGRITGL